MRRALEQGRHLLRRELPEQILRDGGHFERSPSYHRQLLERLGDASAVLDRCGQGSAELDAAVDGMRSWLAALAGPDGMLPRLNDAWDGPPIASGDSAFAPLADSGYLVMRQGGDQAVLDVGPLSPPHLPPHAHADALSFVLWADGRPFVVDPGSGSYRGPIRGWTRSTAAHNTVEVDGQDQCVFLGDFRAVRLPRVRHRIVDHDEDRLVVEASHDGYRRLGDPAVHHRVFCWLPGDGLVIVDVLESKLSHTARSALHLAPGAGASHGGMAIRPLWDATVTESTRLVAPYLGTCDSGLVLEQEASTADRPVQGWSLLRSEARVTREGDRVTVAREGRPDVVLQLP
jgi:hypothetical protein